MMSAFSMNIFNSVAVVTFDTPDQKVNILNLATLEEFGEILDQLEEMGTDLKGAVIISAKERNFIAGADLSLIERISDPDEGAAMARTGQELFDRIAALPFTTVAAIHGSCLGGGLELALACDHRVASDAAETFLGLPETQLGIIPGFGGTQRLPRLVGLLESVRMITTGSPVYPMKALRTALVDEVVKREHLMDAAMAAVVGNLPKPSKSGKNFATKVEKLLEKNNPGRKFLLGKARKAVLANTRGQYPAPMAAIDAIEYEAGIISVTYTITNQGKGRFPWYTSGVANHIGVSICPDSTSGRHLVGQTPILPQRLGEYLMVGGFPGFIWGWSQVPDYTAPEGWANLSSIYAAPFLGLVITMLIYASLKMLCAEGPRSKHLLTDVFAASAVSCYYWFRLPALFGYAPNPGDGMLINLQGILPEFSIIVSRIVTTCLFFWWLVARKRGPAKWSIRPPLRSEGLSAL